MLPACPLPGKACLVAAQPGSWPRDQARNLAAMPIT